MERVYDVVIVGGGPAGLSTAIYTARARLDTIVLDKNPNAGALATADKIENYPGVIGRVSGRELLAIFRKQAEAFGAVIVQAQVMGVNFTGEIKEVMAPEGTYRGRVVVIATGSMGRKPTIPGEERFVGRGVSYCATCDAPFFKDKDVALVGEVNKLHGEMGIVAKFAKRVYLISPKEKDANAQVYQGNVEVLAGWRLLEIKGREVVEEVHIKSRRGREKHLNVSGVFMFLQGSRPVVDFLYGALETGENGCIKVDGEMRTSVEGVYAVGDVRCGKMRQVVLAAADGCTAALSAEMYINRREGAKVQWS